MNTKKLDNLIQELRNDLYRTNQQIGNLKRSKEPVIEMIKDFDALRAFLLRDDIPESVQRAIGYCLKWNPFANEDDEEPCNHSWVYIGHGHNYDLFGCTKCKATKED